MNYVCRIGNSFEIKQILNKNNISDIFMYCCINGYLKMVKFLLYLENTYGKINIHVENHNAFRGSCENGHLEIVKFLLSLEKTHGKINIHTKNEHVFRYSCEYGHLEIFIIFRK